MSWKNFQHSFLIKSRLSKFCPATSLRGDVRCYDLLMFYYSILHDYYYTLCYCLIDSFWYIFIYLFSITITFLLISIYILYLYLFWDFLQIFFWVCLSWSKFLFQKFYFSCLSEIYASSVQVVELSLNTVIPKIHCNKEKKILQLEILSGLFVQKDTSEKSRRIYLSIPPMAYTPFTRRIIKSWRNQRRAPVIWLRSLRASGCQLLEIDTPGLPQSAVVTANQSFLGGTTARAWP